MSTSGRWQRWLWPPGTVVAKKIWISWVLLVMLGALVPLLLQRSFVPSADAMRGALYLSIALLPVHGLWLWRLRARGAWAPSGPWLTYGPVKRWAMGVLVLVFCAAILWIDLAITLPSLYTRLWGMPSQQATQVQPHRSSAKHSCRHQLKIEGIRFPLFEFCIDAEQLAQWPAQPLPATVLLRRSALGMEVLGLRLVRPAPPSTDDPEPGNPQAAAALQHALPTPSLQGAP